MAVKRFYFFGSYSSAPVFRPFIIQINSGADSSFTIPTYGGGYNYEVSTSDGQTFTGVTGNLTITFPSANTLYDISILGNFPRIFFNNGTQRLKLIDIKQWGDIVWGAVQTGAFYGCADMECSALDSPNFSSVTTGNNMFRNASSFNPTNFAPTLENLTSGFFMFQNASSFNPPNFAPTLENLTNGDNMFNGASSFNPPNFAPTLENLTNGSNMFRLATSFAQDIYAPNSVHLVYDSIMFNGTKNEKITLNNTSLTSTDSYTFNCPLLTDLILIDRKISLYIAFSPLLTGIKIDNLFNSLGTANSGATITITTAQSTSGIDTTIATNKGWTIVIV